MQISFATSDPSCLHWTCMHDSNCRFFFKTNQANTKKRGPFGISNSFGHVEVSAKAAATKSSDQHTNLIQWLRKINKLIHQQHANTRQNQMESSTAHPAGRPAKVSGNHIFFLQGPAACQVPKHTLEEHQFQKRLHN